MTKTSIYIAVEGLPDEQVLRKLIAECNECFEVAACYGKNGSPAIWEDIEWLNNAARSIPCIALTDLDKNPCPLGLIQKHQKRFPQGVHKNLLLRIAVREVESWLLADRNRFADFLGVDATKMPPQPDVLLDPKETVISLARRSHKTEVKRDIVPDRDGDKEGRGYRRRIMEFAMKHWRADAAARAASPSLRRAYDAIRKFSPQTG
jgi:hypothetical protein